MEPRQRTLVELFNGAVGCFSDRIAVAAEDGEYTYQELSERSSRLAGELAAMGVRPGATVALLAPRTSEMVVGLLGILKAGAAYVPIDPAYPVKRIEWTTNDSAASVIVSTSGLADVLATQDTRVVLLDRLDGQRKLPDPPEDCAPSADSLAYVIYTSGSTGVPKGVQVEHRNVVRLFEVTREQFGFSDNDVWTVFHSTAFDFSVWEIWGALLYGGRLVIVPLETALSPQAFRNLLRVQQVTVLNQTPSAFHRLATADARSTRRLTSLRVVVFGGEKLEPAALRDWINRYGDERPSLVNMYGITEGTVHASCRPLTADDLDAYGVSPIGDPLSDLAFHVRDEHGRPVPQGEPGELYIEGAGLARGYLGRPESNKERFIEHVGPDGEIHRFYRTGDRVVALSGGGYGYLGRVDDQVKIRGYRVEPGEIEAVLLRHFDVSAAIAQTRDYGGGDVRIVAYVASAADSNSLVTELGGMAAADLPPHMRPSAYVVLHELPLTLNGKLDKDRLPVPGLDTAATPQGACTSGGREFTSTEQRIADIWQSVLEIPHADRDVDFFTLGGTSLSLVRMFVQVNEAFGTDLDIIVLIEGATVGALASQIDAAIASQRIAIT
jgi:amino acid adenylation domain-containing protein